MDSRVRHETREEGRRTYRPKRCDYDNKEEVNSTNIFSNNNYQASSQKFRQITASYSTELFYKVFNIG